MGQRIQGNSNVQIQGAVGSRIEITYNGVTRTVPLDPAHVPVAAKLPSPARLVRAHSGVVPYVERGGLLSELNDWIDSPVPFAGQVIGGRGGTGKTRLAVELCLATEESSWLCGFLSRIADPGMLDALVEVQTARLVVIDYAETRPEQVELLLPLLSAKATPQSPIRVLLLVRDHPDGRGDWASRLADRVDGLDAVLDECEVCYLEDAPFGAAERHELFEGAVPALAEHLRGSPPAAAAPDLQDDVFESPLMVVIAAYLAAHGEEVPTTRDGLLDEVLAHERRYWRESLAGIEIDDALLERMVAVATLVRADNEAQASERLRLLSDLHDAPAERRNRLARWVRSQYPGASWWNPLEPDLVGEHLVARCFAHRPEVLGEAISGSEPDEITRPLEVLTRAAADHPELAATLGPILSTELPRLCAIAVAQAEVAKDGDLLYGNAITVAAAIDGVVSVVQTSAEVLPAVVSLIPHRSDLLLNELALTLTAQLVELNREQIETSPSNHALDLVMSLSSLSVRLSNAGRRDEALKAAEESAETYRQRVETNPAAYTPGLAMVLNNLSNRLSEVGRREEALKAAEEAVEAYRLLAEDNPSVYTPDLAMALNNLSNRLSEVGRREEALKAAEESAEVYQRLADAHPAAHMPNLAKALNNLSLHLSDAGRRGEALKAIEESADVNGQLAETNHAAYAPDLAGALNNLSTRLAEAGRQAEALKASEESVSIRRQLADANPAAHAPALASALNNLSTRFTEVERLEEALEASEESVSIRRQLVKANPAAYKPNLAMSLNNHSVRLAEAGRQAEALEASEESVSIRRQLVKSNPAAYTPNLAISLNNFSARLAEVGYQEQALRTAEEAVETFRRLADVNPAVYSSSLVGALANLADQLKAVGRAEDAEDAHRQIVNLLDVLGGVGEA